MTDRSPPSTQEATIPTRGQGEEGEEEVSGTGQGGKIKTKVEKPAEIPAAPVKEEEKPKDEKMAEGLAEQALAKSMKEEEDAFAAAETALKQAILQSPDLKEYADQIVIDRTSEGLRIQITDRDKLSIFPSSSAIPYERGRELLMMIGKVIALLPNKISISGHTDATPFATGSRRDNWSLSTERANTCRSYLVKAGVNEKNVARVSGLSDREPFTSDPKDARNRRISIVLMRRSVSQISLVSGPVKN
jgi:chemotaxis protein MotB